MEDATPVHIISDQQQNSICNSYHEQIFACPSNVLTRTDFMQHAATVNLRVHAQHANMNLALSIAKTELLHCYVSSMHSVCVVEEREKTDMILTTYMAIK